MCILDILNRITELLGSKEQQELTNHLGLKKTAFSDWKGGKSNSYLKYLIEIAEFFDVSIDFLVYGKEKSSSSEFTKEEREFITLFRELTRDDQMKIIGRMQVISEEYSPEQKENAKAKNAETA